MGIAMLIPLLATIYLLALPFIPNSAGFSINDIEDIGDHSTRWLSAYTSGTAAGVFFVIAYGLGVLSMTYQMETEELAYDKPVQGESYSGTFYDTSDTTNITSWHSVGKRCELLLMMISFLGVVGVALTKVRDRTLWRAPGKLHFLMALTFGIGLDVAQFFYFWNIYKKADFTFCNFNKYEKIALFIIVIIGYGCMIGLGLHFLFGQKMTETPNVFERWIPYVVEFGMFAAGLLAVPFKVWGADLRMQEEMEKSGMVDGSIGTTSSWWEYFGCSSSQ